MLHVYLPRKVVGNFILIRKVARKKRLLILHQSLTFARADNANEYSHSWYPVTLAQSTCGLGKLVFRVCVGKWLNNSPLWSTF